MHLFSPQLGDASDPFSVSLTTTDPTSDLYIPPISSPTPDQNGIITPLNVIQPGLIPLSDFNLPSTSDLTSGSGSGSGSTFNWANVGADIAKIGTAAITAQGQITAADALRQQLTAQQTTGSTLGATLTSLLTSPIVLIGIAALFLLGGHHSDNSAPARGRK